LAYCRKNKTTGEENKMTNKKDKSLIRRFLDTDINIDEISVWIIGMFLGGVVTYLLEEII
jgi:hypothetical protein